ncbi:hypothetical protein BDZ45DRAFT_301713 [Acephala macrosclerotiorum]|nr:hypothetical protein BDZ45DRAFT_301713 [Acephala macrosclerotiorum]
MLQHLNWRAVRVNIANDYSSQLPVPMLILVSYTSIVYITNTTEGFYAHSFRDPSSFAYAAMADHILGIGAGIFGLLSDTRLCCVSGSPRFVKNLAMYVRLRECGQQRAG